MRETGDTRLNYWSVGEPGLPAVLFLHGFMGSSDDWRGVAEALEDRAFAVAVDLPGHGASLGLAPEAYTIEGAAAAVIGALDDLGVEEAAFAGYSMGGRLALYMAWRYPERCSGLLLESASPGIEDEGERAARQASDEEKARRLESEDFEGFLREWYRQPLFASLARDEDLLRRTVETRQKNHPYELARSLRKMGTGTQPPLWGELPGLRVPTLAVAGELDGKFVEIARRMAARSPQIDAVAVPDAGHNVRAEAPEAYLSLLEGFFGD